jgi:hypothetical protein
MKEIETRLEDNYNLQSFPITEGTGTISVSHTTVHGHGSNFLTEFAPGDALIVQNCNKEGEDLIP